MREELKELGILKLSIAKILDEAVAYAAPVTPLSARRKNAKYALMDVKLTYKNAEEKANK